MEKKQIKWCNPAKFGKHGLLVLSLCLSSFAVTQVYYSVGISAADLKNAGTISITSGTATFSTAQSSIVGVGDVISYGAGPSFAYVSSRTSSTVYSVVTNLGAIPPVNVSHVTVNSIKRAFNALNTAVNTGAGGNASSAGFLNTADLVAGNYDLNIACYADGADVGSATVYNWNTDASHYVKIYTPVLPSEVGVTQRHLGTWMSPTAAYTISTTAGAQYVIGILSNFVKVYGLQVSLTGVTTADAIRIDNSTIYLSAAAVIEVAYNLITSSSVVSNIGGVSCWPGSGGGSNITMKVWNNIIWNLLGGSNCGMYLGYVSAPTSYVYNNTTYNTDIGIVSDNGNVVAKNDLIYLAPDSYQPAALGGGPLGIFTGTNDLCGPTTDGDIPPANAKNGATVAFEDPANSDFRLSSADVSARTQGVSLFSDPNLAFADDITGDIRPSTWDIGARQWNDATATQMPILSSPSDGGLGCRWIMVDFTLPEAATTGTVKMTFTQTGGTADANSPHIITFNNTGGFSAAGEHTTILDGNNLSVNSNVASVSSDPNDNLKNLAVYSVRLEYQDAKGNPATAVINTNFTFNTSASSMAAPAQNGYGNASLLVDFYLPQVAQAGSVQMTFTRQAGGSADLNSPHIITFNSVNPGFFEAIGEHTTTLNGADLSTNANVASVSSNPNDNLKDGALYNVALAYNNSGGVAQPVVTNTNFTYYTSAPSWVATYPQLSANMGNSLEYSVDINRNGKAFFVLVPTGAAAPSSAQVKAGLNGSGVAVAAGFSGNITVYTNLADHFTATNLTSGVTYDAYLVAQDLVPNLQAAPVKITTTTNDITPPVWAGGYPNAGTVNGTDAQFLAKTNENGNAYVVVLPSGASAPTSLQVKNGQNAAGTSVAAGFSDTVQLSANTQGAVDATGLSASTTYDAYMVAEDVVPNLQVAPVKVTIMTIADIVPPVTTATYPKIKSVTGTTAQFVAKTNENGMAYFVIVADPSTTPSSAQVKLGQNSSGASVAAGFQGNVALTANTEGTLSASTLTSGVTYDVYLVAQDAVPNVQAAPAKIVFTTGTQPAIRWSRYDLTNVKGTSVGDSKVYVGASNTVYGLALSNGTTSWSYNSGQGACGAPTYDWVGGNYEVVVCQGTYLIRYDDPGGMKWMVNLGASPGTPFVSVDDNSVYVLLANNMLTKRSMATGTRDGTFGNGSDVAVANSSILSSLIVYSGYVVVGSTNGVVTRYEAGDGTLHSTYTTGSNVAINQPLISYNNVLYAAPANNAIYACDATNINAAYWSAAPTLIGNNTAAPFVDFNSSPTIIYTASVTKLQKWTDNGSGTTPTNNWTYDALATIEGGPIIYNGYVYFGRDDNRYYCINATTQAAAANWPYLNASGNAVVPPSIDAVSATNQVIFGTDAGDLHAFATQ